MTESNVKWGFLAVSLLTAAPLTTAAPLAGQGEGWEVSIAVGGGEVIVGESLNETSPGYAYVYRKDSGGVWAEVQRLEASNSSPGDHFGRTVTLSGDQLLVGSTLLEAIYVFEKDGSDQWRETQILTASDAYQGNSIGRISAADGDHFFTASWTNSESRGAVYAFERDPATGRWSETDKLMGSDVGPNESFGMSIAVEGDVALIGTPRKDNGTGAAYVFRRDETTGEWSERSKLVVPGASPNSGFGVAVGLDGGVALIAAAGLDIVFEFSYDDSTEAWQPSLILRAFDGGYAGTGLGTALHFDADEAWLGAPGASAVEGRVYMMYQDPSGEWTGATKLVAEDLVQGEQFGGVLAVQDDLAAVGILLDDFELGSVAIFERQGGVWSQTGKVFKEPDATFASITGGQVDCEEGAADAFGCSDLDLLSFLSLADLGGGARGVNVNDLWGWTDPDSGGEYVLVGRYDGTSFIDVSDPVNPRYLGDLPVTEGATEGRWRDIKVYQNHAFIVADGSGAHGIQIFDLTKLRDVRGDPVTFEEDAHYSRIASAHNIVINEETGFAYVVGASEGGETCGGGLHMINIQEPLAPLFVGCFQDMGTGRQGTGYTHDAQCVVYHGPDVEHQGREICFAANETALSIADVTDKSSPVSISTATYPNVAYAHQGWLDEEHRYFYTNDELDELYGNVDQTRTLIWDIADLDDPILVREYFADNASTDHNFYIRGDLMYQSNYVSGLRILDISDRENPQVVSFFDTVPGSSDAPGFGGSWSNYPFFESGIIVVTSRMEGIFVLRKREPTVFQ
ncbi:MAG: choice-of-anchor B family protein [Gemmatimonadetes bacterium]|nr:choice-of-anchor B family protein [Gemmatimonadota bacterium]